jgi:hypothetical protein
MENNIEIPQSVLKENQKYACKSTKKERRKKVMKFADLATKRCQIKETVDICMKGLKNNGKGGCKNKDKKCHICSHYDEYKEIK